MRCLYGMVLASFVFAGFSLTGCGSKTETETVATEAVAQDPDGDENASNDHSGWWCVEHGVPEEECALCDRRLIADFKAKGDWCDEHNRPQSQCFTCEPELFEKFAARYEAKFGEQPPQPTE